MYKEGEDWSEPALNIHTPLSSTPNPIFFLCLSLNSVAPPQKKTILRYTKYCGGGDLPLPPGYAYCVYDTHIAINSTFPIRPAIRTAMSLVRFV